jgi:flagella basal body P-ring formation protein FlgA
MKNGRLNIRSVKTVSLLTALVCALAFSGQAQAEGQTAVVPTRIIYPGETIEAVALEEVAVTNPNLTGNYAHTASEVTGRITDRTLLPGRTIIVDFLREPFAVKRGAAVKLIYSSDGLTISATGTPMEDGGVGQVVRVRNFESGVTISGTVMTDGSIKVLSQ